MKKAAKIVIYFTLPLYILLLVYILFLYSREHYGASSSFAEYLKCFTNVIPFKSVSLYVNDLFTGHIETPIANLLGNLLFFLPMGLYLPCLFGRFRKFGGYIICILCILIAVEAAQLLLRTGSFDIDDLILNLAGACLGFLIFKKLVQVLFKQNENVVQAESAPVE